MAAGESVEQVTAQTSVQSSVQLPLDPDVAERVEKLRALVLYHQHRYYLLDDPEISDQEFDALFRELQELEAEHPALRTADSPTVRVGGVISDRFEKTRHPMPMLSLANAFGPEDLRAWRERVRRLLPQEDLARLARACAPLVAARRPGAFGLCG